MTSWELAAAHLLVLLIEGWLVVSLIAPKTPKKLRAALALPTATFVNVGAHLFLILRGSSLTFSTAIAPHIFVILFCIIFLVKPYNKIINTNTESVHDQQLYSSMYPRVFQLMRGASVVILIAALLYSFTHATLLPTHHYDSATNWNMRSKISFHEQQIVFDDHNGMIRKPHYPFLYHALQLTVHSGQQEWSDALANTAHFLLALSSLIALALLLSLLRGRSCSLLSLGALLGTPLFTLHLGQGYADVPLLLYCLLSALSIQLFLERRSHSWLWLSVLFVSACTWTKSEGLFFCFLPWAIIVGYLYYKNLLRLWAFLVAEIASAFLSLFWLALIWWLGIPLTPHASSDLSLQLSAEGISTYFTALFSTGSFGLLWFVIAVFALTLSSRKTRLRTFPHVHSAMPLLLWGALTFIGYSIVYVCTSNVEYLINGQAFDRQMLLPGFLLLVGFLGSLPWPQAQN